MLAAQFETADFDGPFLASFGRPELRGAWIIWGTSGSGKTTFTLQLCKYLAGFRRVAYNSLEQGLSLSLQRAWERVEMAEAGSNIILLNKETLPELRARLSKRKSPEIIVIDSVQYLTKFYVQQFNELKEDFPDKLFIFISQADKAGKDPAGSVAKHIRYDADIKIKVEGYKAFVTTRYEDPTKGEGGADFIIWQQGANDYWAGQI
ncbi:ATP-dependent serine protease [Bacteroides acidifaciens]|uniref:ATP-dependent serine protease n=1 Tax=Bacteroides acidifaciens TaxID=85831 RepID=A0A3L8A9Z9_9BACE|nr:ATP-dependent serine protease [Bacteroides acidifaciens]